MGNAKYLVANKAEISPKAEEYVDPLDAISAAKQKANTTGKTQVILCFVREITPTANHVEKPKLI